MSSMPTSTNRVFLLHGLGSHPLTFWPMRLHLEHSGYSRVHALGYTVDTVPLEDAVQEVSAQMMKICGSQREPVFVVGQSMGGLVANRLHNHGWQVARAVCIASPLHGARLLGTLHSWLPACVWNALDKEAYQTLRAKGREPAPPHPVSTISFGWGWSDFDGCVFADEVVMRQDHHHHLAWADHRIGFVDPRLWRLVTADLDGTPPPPQSAL
jgi:pimeloyl-ACP methyl ester carboxylesterase